MTQISYIPVYQTQEIDFDSLNDFFFTQLNNNNKIAIFYPIQYEKIYQKIKEKYNTKYEFVEIKLTNCYIPNQILGCNNYQNAITPENILKLKESALIFFLGDGFFHSDALIELLLRLNISTSIYFFDTKKITKINPEKIIEKINIKTKKLILFYSKQKIGIIKSIKHGQTNHKIIQKTIEICKKHNKDYYLFLSNTIDLNKLPDFNKIELWINTACSRIFDDDLKKNIIDARDLIEYEQNQKK